MNRAAPRKHTSPVHSDELQTSVMDSTSTLTVRQFASMRLIFLDIYYIFMSYPRSLRMWQQGTI